MFFHFLKPTVLLHGNILSAGFRLLYPFALLKLRLHIGLFSLVVISAVHLIRGAVFLQEEAV